MNKGLIFGIGFGLGAGCGIAGTYFYMKKLQDKLIDDVIDDFKENYHIRSRYPVVDEIEPAGEVNPVDIYEEGLDRPSTVQKSSLTSEPVEIERVNYSDLAQVYKKSDDILTSDEEEKTVEDILLEGEHPQDGSEEDIHTISIDEFAMDDEYDKTSLVWYTGDDVLVDEDGYEIEDRSILVGDILEDLIDVIDEPTLYVRNDISGMDYDIDVVDGESKDFIQ